MKLKKYLFGILCLFILKTTQSFSQIFVPYNTKYQSTVKGDFQIIGNNILNRKTATETTDMPCNGTTNNNAQNMEYIDIDSDPSTFCSSSCDFIVSNFNTNCNTIKYAALYWTAILQTNDRTDIDKVKLKIPNLTDYYDITGQIIYDANATPISQTNIKPYVCYADVTNLVKSTSNPIGTYTVGNIISSQGVNYPSGLTAGWSLFIVYTDPNGTYKSITAGDDFIFTDNYTPISLNISGFNTPASGTVQAKYAFSSLEGDASITSDYLKINDVTQSNSNRPENNFFNSSINSINGVITNRLPNSSNTLGFDIGEINIPNAGNSVIANGANNVTIMFGGADTYLPYFHAIAITNNRPELKTIETITDLSGNPITGTLPMGGSFQYKIDFSNVGNDDMKSLTLKTILPQNVTFNPASDLILPTGVTYAYTIATHQLVFTIPDNLVVTGSNQNTIIIKVAASTNCEDYKDACSNKLLNQVFGSYTDISNSIYTDEPSNTNCSNTQGEPVEVTIDASGCNYTKNVDLCPNTVINLTAANGYSNYIWRGPLPSTSIIGTMQTITVSEGGTYTVESSTNTCRAITETFEVLSCIIIREGNTLKASQNNANYQWIDCDNGNQPISGETSQSFSPSQSGHYALVVTNSQGHSVTSSCVDFTLLNNQDFSKTDFNVYPNPIVDVLHIEHKDNIIEEVALYNLLNQKVFSSKTNDSSYDINELNSGTYLLQITTKENKVYKQLVIKK